MELSDVGAHCQRSDCKQKDFLPFKCSLCGGIFCLQHRSNHGSCSHPDKNVLFCPICKQQVLVRSGEDEQKNLAEHAMSKCSKHRVSAPPMSGCKFAKCQKKTDIPFLCSICEQSFCLTHRAPDNHQCPGPKESTSICSIM